MSDKDSFKEWKSNELQLRRQETSNKAVERQSLQDMLQGQLKLAITKKHDYIAEKERVQKELEEKEKRQKEELFQIEKTLLIPDKEPEELPEHPWTEEELKAKTLLKKKEEVLKKVPEKEPRKLTKTEKLHMVQREMRQLQFDDMTFYDQNPTWFAFETRCRDMMIGMVEPLIRKTLSDTTYMAKVLQNQEIQANKHIEFEYLMQKVVKNLTNQDDFNVKLHNYDTRTNDREMMLGNMMEETKRINANCQDCLMIMKDERGFYRKEIDVMKEEMRKYFEKMQMFQIDVETDMEKSINKFKNILDVYTNKVDKATVDLDCIKTTQENIAENYKKFGAEIEINQHNIKKLKNMCEHMRYQKLDQSDHKLFVEKVNHRLDQLQQYAEFTKDQVDQTDKYLQVYQPISFVSEISKMFGAVLPRRRHLVKLERYTNERQGHLRNVIDEVLGQKFDKTYYEMANFPAFDRKQSPNSDYVRDVCKMFKQQQAARAGVKHLQSTSGSKGKGRKTIKYGKTMHPGEAGSALDGLKPPSSEEHQQESHGETTKKKAKKMKHKIGKNVMRSMSVSLGQGGNNVLGLQAQNSVEKQSAAQKVTAVLEKLDASDYDQESYNKFIREESSASSDKADNHTTNEKQDKTKQMFQKLIEDTNKKSQEQDMEKMQEMMDRLQRLEYKQVKEEEERKEWQKQKENEDLLGEDGKSQKLSTIEDDEDGELQDKEPKFVRKNLMKSKQITQVLSTESQDDITQERTGEAEVSKEVEPLQVDMDDQLKEPEVKAPSEDGPLLKTEINSEESKKDEKKSSRRVSRKLSKKLSSAMVVDKNDEVQLQNPVKEWKKKGNANQTHKKSKTKSKNKDKKRETQEVVQSKSRSSSKSSAKSSPKSPIKSPKSPKSPKNRVKSPKDKHEKDQKKQKKEKVKIVSRSGQLAHSIGKFLENQKEESMKKDELLMESNEIAMKKNYSQPQVQIKAETPILVAGKKIESENDYDLRNIHMMKLDENKKGIFQTASSQQIDDNLKNYQSQSFDLVDHEMKSMQAPNVVKVRSELMNDQSPIIDIKIPGGSTITKSELKINYQKSTTMKTRSDFDSSEEDEAGDGADRQDSLTFVTKEQLDAVKKEVEEIHTATHALHDYIQDVQEEMRTVRTRINDRFSWTLYQQDLKDVANSRNQLAQQLERETAEMRALIKEVEAQELNDRKYLWEEVQNTNRRVFTTKRELREDMDCFSRVFKDQDNKMVDVLYSTKSLLSLTELLNDVILLQSSLLKQDELDKKSIFLMGTRDAERQLTKAERRERQVQRLFDYYGEQAAMSMGEVEQKNLALLQQMYNDKGEPPKEIVSLTENCISCGDQPKKVLEAFKMACLTYKPSLVPFKNQMLTRDHLMMIMDEQQSSIFQNGVNATKALTKLEVALGKLRPQSGTLEPNDLEVVRSYKPGWSDNDRNMMKMLEEKDPFKYKKVERKVSSVLAGSGQDATVSNENLSSKNLDRIQSAVQMGMNSVKEGRRQVSSSLEGKKFKIDQIDNRTNDERRLRLLGLLPPDQQPVDQDAFNDGDKGLINAEVRDQADRMYLDIPNRDINGNNKNPIGTAIDDIKTREFYQQDYKYEAYLQKLTKIRRKSSMLYQKGTLAKRGVDQFLLQSMNMPLTRPDTETDMAIEAQKIQGFKTQYDEIIKNRRTVQDIRNVERKTRETLTPSGSGYRNHMRRFLSQEFERNMIDVPETTWGNMKPKRQSFSFFSPMKQQHMKRVQKMASGEDLKLLEFNLNNMKQNPNHQMGKDRPNSFYALLNKGELDIQTTQVRNRDLTGTAAKSNETQSLESSNKQ